MTTAEAIADAGCCRVKTALRHGGAIVDYRSILRSIREPGLLTFLRRCEWPEILIDYTIDCAKALSPEAIFSMLQLTFISYGHPVGPPHLGAEAKAAGQ